MNQIVRITTLVVAVGALLLSSNADAARKAKDLLEHIPAETPYVMAFTKPMPDDLMDKFEPVMDKTLSSYQSIMRYKMSEHLIELSAEEGGAEKAAELQEFMDEVLGLMSVKGLRDAGIGRDALFAIYGDGILPVFRIALTDSDKFEAAVARLESSDTKKMPVGNLRGKPYRYIDLDEMRLIIATIDKDAVITVVPATVSEERLARTLGLTKPRNNLARNKELRKIARENGFTDHFVSFIDVERIAASFLGDPTGLNTELLEIAEHDSDKFSEQCRAEFMSLAGIAPRVVMGYTEVNKNFLETGMVVELREDIAAGLMTLPAAVPGLGPDLGGLFSFGFSLNPLALRSFYEARLDAMEEEPYECEKLAELQASTVKGREALAQPIPPVVYSFRGILANVTNLEGMDLETQTPPEVIEANVLFALENAQDLVTMAAMMSPEIAALNLLPDGVAKEVNLPQLAEIADEVFAALSEGGVAMAFGDGAAGKAEDMLTAKTADTPPFMSGSFDAQRYYDFIGNAAMQEEEEDGEPMPLAMRNAIRDIMVSSGELYERMAVKVHLTERGVEVDSRMTFAD